MILITGASSGIGEACARVFAHEGKELFLLARRIERLETLCHELRASSSSVVRIERLDVSHSEQVMRFVENHAELLSQVRVLVNNAGLARGFAPFQEGNPDDWEEMIETNLKGVIYMTRALLPHLIAQGRGTHIVNLGSVAGRWIYPNGNVYCATKAAIHAFTQGLRHDLLGTGVRVTEITPGMVETEFSLVRLRDSGMAKEVYRGMTPLSGKDVAEAIRWVVNQPDHVNVQELVMYPTDQASPTLVYRTP